MKQTRRRIGPGAWYKLVSAIAPPIVCVKGGHRSPDLRFWGDLVNARLTICRPRRYAAQGARIDSRFLAPWLPWRGPAHPSLARFVVVPPLRIFCHERSHLEVALPSQDEMLKAVAMGIQAFANVEMGLGFIFRFHHGSRQ